MFLLIASRTRESRLTFETAMQKKQKITTNICYIKQSHTSQHLQMSIPDEKISVQRYKINVKLPQGEVDFGTATRELLNELRLI